MSETLAGSSERRLPRMQASGLPHGHVEPQLHPGGLDYGDSQRYRPKSPFLSPASSRDHPPLPLQSQPHDYRSLPSASRRLSENAPLSLSHSHQDRANGAYQPTQSDPRDRNQYREQRSPNFPPLPPRASTYGASPEVRQRHYYEQWHHSYQEQGYPRRSSSGLSHTQASQAYSQHPNHPLGDARGDDVSRVLMRPGLPSPSISEGRRERLSPSNEYRNHASLSVDNVERSSYRHPASAHDRRYQPDEYRHSLSRPSTSTSPNAAAYPLTATRSTPASSTSTSRKRKKQFKYMLEHEGPDPSSKTTGLGGDEEDQDRDQLDQLEADPEAESAHRPKESRKKVKKACIFCKRSHMPCEEARPCKRCVKRGISHLCRDAEPVNSSGAASTSTPSTKSKFGEARQQARARRQKQDGARRSSHHNAETESESDLESLASSAASSLPLHAVVGSRRHDMNAMPGAAAPDPDVRTSLSISTLLRPTQEELVRRPVQRSSSPGLTAEEQKQAWNRSMDPSTQHKMKRMLEAGPAGKDLRDMFAEMPTSLLMTPATANGLDVKSILRHSSAEPYGPPDRRSSDEKDDERQRSQRSHSIPSSSEERHADEAVFKLPSRPKHLLQEEAATTSELRGGPPTYSYTYGYAKLARWMHTRFSRANCEKVDQSLSIIRPKLMALSRSLPEEELIGVEDSFYRLLDFYVTNVLETIPIPMIVARRTGEIYAANSHACKLFQLPPSIFQGGQICHYQLVTEKDCVNMWGKYAQEAQGMLDVPPSTRVMLEVDRSLLMFDRPGLDPRTGEVVEGECEDGGEMVVRKEVVVTFEAKLSTHGLPFMVTGTIVPIPEKEE
ncbi:hypothetical protein PHSY_003456 [Pseudozyma hubeiensis SY62]|uniref:Zn(2)-C6 fungal-type domain-containing protein n=1 Tax=Pseudozyma hubeiensis (strain SY62) TaxID=1305764 RepID=R9P379_PSEHS|nr:hypothetical protein PHSY_003456 [Pseudozyma hubeiensis SY62]GAC95878.1 hypothetical protein PHSY_003456 [Pseudozyma hubeiensis SY62]